MNRLGATAVRKVALWGAVVILVAGILVGLYDWNQQRARQAAAFAASARLMGLTQVNDQPAPDMNLIDQNGNHVSLSSFRGKVVVLEFMDPVCTDICPIVSAELIQANQLLGSRSRGVVFVAVNVNQYHESVADVKKFTDEHGLGKLNNWYFLTGSTNQLQKVWKDYSIYVKPNPTGDVEHSSIMYFIDRNGNQRALANPDNNQSQVRQWAKGIAAVALQMV